MVQPTFLVVGLGNPGAEYRGTRHNVGFDLIDLLALKAKIKIDKSKHKAQLGIGMIEETPVALCKPLTFMNLSGQSVAPLMRDYGLKPEHILIVADDLDLPVGKLRLRLQGSAGGHNGHKSIIGSIGTEEYPRLKIGIGHGTDPTIDHVLGRFNPEDRVDIDQSLKAAVNVATAFITGGYDSALRELEKTNRN